MEGVLTFNPEVLCWARERMGYSLEDMQSIKLYQHMADWESGAITPSLQEVRTIAKKLNRSYIEFYLSAVPNTPEPERLPDFRAAEMVQDSLLLRRIHRWADSRRREALGLYQILEDVPGNLPPEFTASVNDDPEDTARKIRPSLGLNLRIKGFNEGNLLKDLIARLEGLGVLVLRQKELAAEQIRGMCLSERPLPAIVLGDGSKAALTFTLLHELGHIVLGTSGISGEENKDNLNHRVEKWCDRFSGAMLIAPDAVRTYLNDNTVEITNRSQVYTMARKFGVSEHAMSVRLVQLEEMPQSHYWKNLKPQFTEEHEKSRSRQQEKQKERNAIRKKEGKPTYGQQPEHVMARLQSGALYSQLVLAAMHADRILVKHALRYLDMSKASQLHKLEQKLQKAV